MDVTALLNSGAAAAAAAEQQKKTDNTRSLSRSRTPWDAGGYSLPINTLSLAPNPMPPQQHPRDEPTRLNLTPTSPTHKLSDSRSSFSSFTSSLQSTTHSRFSSMSTVNSSHPISNISLGSLSPKLIDMPRALDFGTIDSQNDLRLRASLSPTGSLDTLALVAEHHPFSQQPTESISNEPEVTVLNENSTSRSFSETPPYERPSSPSDAILIKRSAIPILRINTGDSDLKREDLPQLNENYLSAPLEHFQQTTHKFHQRSFSAPNLWPAMGDSNMQYNNHKTDCSSGDNPGIHRSDQESAGAHRTSTLVEDLQSKPVARSPSSYHTGYNGNSAIDTTMRKSLARTAAPGQMAELTPPSSHHPDYPSPIGESLSYPVPDTPPVIAPESEAYKVECLFVAACNTKSSLRKAISHIFGRNKLCTRQIPQEIWVHFCRKHYQRSRYRNPKEYSKLQCDLVQKQIRRIHDWSNANAEAGRSGIVKDWELTVRKREQKRLNELSSTNRKRGFEEIENNEDDEDEGENGIPSSTAVPQWLLDCCRKGYDTREILDVFNRLHTEVLADRITNFPDIEILPNITTESDVPNSPKGYTKRTTTINHRRTQSLGPPLQSSSASPVSRSSRSSTLNEDCYSSPQQKRRRPASRIEDQFDERILPRSRHGERTMEITRRMPQLAHRPTFPDIREHQREDYGDLHYPNSPLAYHAPLLAPTPQRSNKYSMAAHLENSDSYGQGARSSLHARSRSDISGFGSNQIDYPAPSIGFGMDVRHLEIQERDQSGYPYPPPPQYTHQQYRDESPAPGRRPEVHMNNPLPSHQRHQSTPQISHAAPSRSYGRPPPLPSYSLPHQSSSSSFTYRSISETDATRDLYNTRR